MIFISSIYPFYIAEERQDQNAKRRKIEAEARKDGSMVAVKPSSNLQLSGASSAPGLSSPHGLPPRPNFDSFENTANSLGFGASAPGTAAADAAKAAAVAAITGSNIDWVENRRQIRMANLSAAEMLKAEMMSAVPVNPAARRKHMAELKAATAKAEEEARAKEVSPPTEPVSTDADSVKMDGVIPEAAEQPVSAQAPEANQLEEPLETEANTAPDNESSPQGVKRKLDDIDAEGEDDDDDDDLGPDESEEDAPAATSSALARQVNPDGSVDQEDTVK